MSGQRLTKTFVASLEPRSATYMAFDSDLPGFGVRVTKAGAKTWIINYRSNGGGRRAPVKRFSIAATSVMTAEKARDAAKDLLAKVRLGADPAAEKAAGRKAATIAELSIEYLKPDAQVSRKASTLALYKLYFRKHINPAIGSRRAIDLSSDDVVRLHRKIGATSKATANRVVMTLGGMFTWATRTKHLRRPDNPARNIDLYKEKSRERFLSSQELGQLGDAIREAETIGLPYEVDETGPKAKHAPKLENRRTVFDPFTVAAVRLLLLTGARLREILHLRWSDVDLERGLLNLTDSKTGKKSIILNAPALAVLSGLPRVGAYVIASTSAGSEDERPKADLHRPWRAIIRKAGLDGLRIHDLRHTHASAGAGAGVSLQVIGRILGHRHSETTEKYAHLADDPLRRASERIGTDLAAALGDPLPPAAPVAELPHRQTRRSR